MQIVTLLTDLLQAASRRLALDPRALSDVSLLARRVEESGALTGKTRVELTVLQVASVVCSQLPQADYRRHGFGPNDWYIPLAEASTGRAPALLLRFNNDDRCTRVKAILK